MTSGSDGWIGAGGTALKSARPLFMLRFIRPRNFARSPAQAHLASPTDHAFNLIEKSPLAQRLPLIQRQTNIHQRCTVEFAAKQEPIHRLTIGQIGEACINRRPVPKDRTRSREQYPDQNSPQNVAWVLGLLTFRNCNAALASTFFECHGFRFLLG
jgi:hypothetical protein